MKNSGDLSDSQIRDEPNATCRQCGSKTRLNNGLCVNCLLGEGLEADAQASTEVFERVLGEAEVPDKQWRMGNYEILEEIARGGMGVIYRAQQRHSRRVVAVKRVLSYHAGSHDALTRFRREAEAAANLDHPNILPIYEVGESDDGLPFFSMKYVTGGSLQQIASNLRDDPRRSVELMIKIARAVEYAHGRGILHRDLKPANVLVDGRGEPLVTDFGLAKSLDAVSDLTRTLTSFGTPGYIAPEQAQSAAADLSAATDVYSLGAILFYLLTGRPPFIGDNALIVIQQAANSSAPRLRSLEPSLDRDLETICARCLEHDPRARYQSAGDLADDLERWLEKRPIAARPLTLPIRIWRWSRRNPKLVGATVAGLLIGAAAIWFAKGNLIRSSAANPPE
ncbi:MAG TPA: serine/threonine-protein kinase, partial [Pyrinomonadaceae bacterium]|nr:serine/threonine-protein kinase [Pyrinomonadaceae bacterium]